ncbi:MAG: hypothetical protein IJ735_02750 [Clostridia bacterium]|nr:hypothetical protein [Clostridia bacterium]
MDDKLLFYIVKEFRQTESMSGKIWRIKVVSGTLRVGQKVRFFGVKIEGFATEADGVVKSMRRDVGLSCEDVEEASESDIVTIDIKNCYSKGKKINKNDIFSTKVTLGGEESVECDRGSSVTLELDKCDEFLEKLVASLERSKKHGYEASLLWFGNRVSIAVADVELSESDAFVAKFNVNGSPLPIPVDPALREIVKFAVVKDRQLVKSFGRNKSGIHEWRYYNGTMVF